jgi:Raf kinase inhibitor-like YbhB/YbcL family protein
MKPFFLRSTLALAVACIPALALGASAAPVAFTLASSNFTDGGSFSAAQIGTNARCGGGQGRSPELTWSGVPKAAQSYAVVVFDVDARKGSGFVHWVDYGIPASTTEISEGAATPGASPYVAGLNSAGTVGYLGPCPPAGAPAHHYRITVYALDLPPDVLAGGKTRDELLTALQKHILASSTIVGLYRVSQH